MKPNIGQGDKGKTHLAFGSKDSEKVRKDDSRVEAAGVLDELISRIGVIRTLTRIKKLDMLLEKIQDHLFRIQAHTVILPARKNHPALPYLGEELIQFLEDAMMEYEKGLPVLKNFIYPGGTHNRIEAEFHVARTLSRTAERRLVTVSADHELHPYATAYVNRLSDLFFTLARWCNHKAKKREIKWVGREKREV